MNKGGNLTPIRLCIYDPTAGYLSRAWATGGMLGKALGKFDYVAPATTPADVKRLVGDAVILDTEYIDEVQIWGHGYSGSPRLDGRHLDVDDVIEAVSRAHRPTNAPARPLVWFRSCSVFQGTVGKRYATDLAFYGACDVAGHTRIVSGVEVPYVGLVGTPWQSGLYALRPGEAPHWDSDDHGGSGPLAPNTTLLTRMSVPDWAFQ